jgi:hypothetical protein
MEKLSRPELRKIRKKIGDFLDNSPHNIYVTGLLVKMAHENIDLDTALQKTITDPSCTEEHLLPFRNAAGYIRENSDKLKKIKI